MSKVSGVLRFVRCPGSSHVWSRDQVPIFVKRHCTGVNLVEECYGPPDGHSSSSSISPMLLVFLHRLKVQSVSCPLHLLHLCNLSFPIGMPNRSCILELRASQCFVCNFLSVPRCRGANAKLRRRKPIVLVALHEISETC